MSDFGKNIATMGVVSFLFSLLLARGIRTQETESMATSEFLIKFVVFFLVISVITVIIGFLIMLFSKDNEEHGEVHENQTKRKFKNLHILQITGIGIQFIGLTLYTIMVFKHLIPYNKTEEEILVRQENVDSFFVTLFFSSYFISIFGTVIWLIGKNKRGNDN